MKRMCFTGALLCLLALLCAACGSSHDAAEQSKAAATTSGAEKAEMYISGEKELLTPAELSERFPIVAYGIVVEMKEIRSDIGYSFLFQVKEGIRGITSDVPVEVHSYDSIFQNGGDFILFMEPWESVFTQTSYYVCADQISVSRDKAEAAPALEEIKKTVSGHPFKGEEKVSGAYFKTTDLRELYELSPYVVKVRVTGTERENPGNVIVSGSVLEAKKGVISGNISISTGKGSVKAGETYYFFLNRVGETNLFIINSPIAVVLPDSEEELLIQKLP